MLCTPLPGIPMLDCCGPQVDGGKFFVVCRGATLNFCFLPQRVQPFETPTQAPDYSSWQLTPQGWCIDPFTGLPRARPDNATIANVPPGTWNVALDWLSNSPTGFNVDSQTVTGPHVRVWRTLNGVLTTLLGGWDFPIGFSPGAYNSTALLVTITSAAQNIAVIGHGYGSGNAAGPMKFSAQIHPPTGTTFCNPAP